MLSNHQRLRACRYRQYAAPVSLSARLAHSRHMDIVIAMLAQSVPIPRLSLSRRRHNLGPFALFTVFTLF